MAALHALAKTRQCELARVYSVVAVVINRCILYNKH